MMDLEVITAVGCFTGDSARRINENFAALAASGGAVGPAGAQGETGPSGPPGSQGETGAQGLAGATGAQGPQGPQGNAGAPGPQGDPGNAGAQGAQGIQGPPGADGADGADGAQGAQGPPGDVSACWPVGSVFISAVSTNPATLLGFGTWAAFAAGKVLVGLDATDPDFDTVEETGGAKTVTVTSAEMPSHTHVQDAHTHTQNAHTHVQDAHTHTQDAHSHLTQRYPTATGGLSGFTIDTSMSGTLADNTLPTKAATATNQNATATNQNATAVNQNATATNQSTGGGGAHNNLQPYCVVYMWKRTA